MNLRDFIVGVAVYAKDVAAPQIPKTGPRALFYGSARIVELQADYLAKVHAPLLRRLGLVSADGEFNLDVLEQAGYDTFSAIPLAEFEGYSFQREDFSDLMNHLKGVVKD